MFILPNLRTSFVSIISLLIISCSNNEESNSDSKICDSGTYEGNVTLNNQNDVDAFGELCYSKINGYLHINGLFDGNEPFITDLTSLRNIKEVTGALSIGHNKILSSLEGLEGIEKVGHIHMEENESLTSIEALSGIQTVNGSDMISDIPKILIQQCYVLTNLEGLQNISDVGNLEIYTNDALLDLFGLRGMNNISNQLSIHGNRSLTSLEGLESLKTVNQVIYIRTNTGLEDFCALDYLINMGGFNGEWLVDSNQFNPTLENMQKGNCN